MNTRYDLNMEVPPREAVRLLYISKSRFGGDWRSVPHTHACTEMFYCVSGRGQFNIEGKLFDVAPDDLIIVNPRVQHTELSYQTYPLEYIVLGIDGAEFLFNEKDLGYTMLSCGMMREELLFLMRMLLREIDSRADGCEMVCQDILEVLLVKIVREAAVSMRIVQPPSKSKECAAAKRYIDENFSENITLDKLAEITHVNKYYLSHTFQREYNTSPINYLLNRRITEETTNLTNALKGNSKVQGDWGEMILETILESSNLVNGIHYTTQQNFKDEEGNNLRPDVVLNLPDSKQIVIDSKVSLTAFVNYVHADDASERDKAMKEHLRSVRAHVDELGCKSYQSLVNSPDFVIMFIPNEPAFLAALQGDPSIWGDAYRRKVIISSPTNLFALLKIVDDLWKRDNQSKNALAIAREGANLYDKFVGFAETLLDIGKNLDTASRNYEKAMGQLKTGKGNLIARSEKLREMGVKATKSLPSALNDYEEDSLKIE